ncbi:ribonuclease H-like domain-containing protein [Candidatus Woesearchaeota archaeon]|nr:ribonuclease H-like domain-containing protein [Candidatus Woesearchaeota archaeon]
MIQQTFQILERVGEKKEQNLWQQGIPDWDAFIQKQAIKGVPEEKKAYFNRQLHYSKKALFNQDSSYFLNKLPSTETWRLYGVFREETVFLDIETDGLGADADITVIGLFNGLETKSMIKGINLDYQVLKHELSKYKLIVTFNGASFDLPFIRKRYDILPPVPHIDLRHLCARLGLTGGLKEIEKRFNINRSRIIEKFSGGDALTLWKMYRATGDDYYLKLLVEYNEEDVINLKKIMNHCYGELSKKLKLYIA